ncbi:MAG: CHC2 zinc finger domain-containing protein [Rhodobacteraceae bacterium]|nr:CHC2 zinc finger domain-containing protein [Paracoccaceae bacterium]
MPRTGLLDFTKIRDAIHFQTVLDHYDLKPEKPGTKQVKINCPFHDDSTPSLSINLEKGIYNCFGCPAEGNVLDFIAEMEGFTENRIYQAAKYGLELIGEDPQDFRKDNHHP